MLTPRILAGLVALLLSASTSYAEPAFCDTRTEITQRLEAHYSEQPIGGGLQNTYSLIEVWQAEGGESWTILMTRADGVSCVMATGTDWQNKNEILHPSKTVRLRRQSTTATGAIARLELSTKLPRRTEVVVNHGLSGQPEHILVFFPHYSDERS